MEGMSVSKTVSFYGHSNKDPSSVVQKGTGQDLSELHQTSEECLPSSGCPGPMLTPIVHRNVELPGKCIRTTTVEALRPAETTAEALKSPGSINSQYLSTAEESVENHTPEAFPCESLQKDEKPKEVRKLFPIFNKSTWLSTRKPAQPGSSPQSLSKKRAHKSSSEDPLKDLKIKRKKWANSSGKGGKDVYFLDAGQKHIGHRTCKVCGMVYTIGLPEDEEVHLRFHNGFVSGIAFPGWKSERTVARFDDGRLICVLPSDPKYSIKKVSDVCKVVDSELGYADSVPVFREGSKAFLFISSLKRVIGFIVADSISKGNRLLPATTSPASGSGADPVPWCCSLQAEPAVLGVNRMWVSQHHRRRRLATRMLEAIRSYQSKEGGIPRELIAFSDPSPSGRKFAERYIGTPTFLVYQWYC